MTIKRDATGPTITINAPTAGSYDLGASVSAAFRCEDATSGVEAGRAGGFGLVVGVGAGEHAAALRARGAHAVVADLAEVRLRGRRSGAAGAR